MPAMSCDEKDAVFRDTYLRSDNRGFPRSCFYGQYINSEIVESNYGEMESFSGLSSPLLLVSLRRCEIQ